MKSPILGGTFIAWFAITAYPEVENFLLKLLIGIGAILLVRLLDDLENKYFHREN